MISEDAKIKFQDLQLAVSRNEVALLEAVRNRDGQPATLLCLAVERSGGGIDFVPIAEILEGNAIELYTPPDGADTGASPDDEIANNPDNYVAGICLPCADGDHQTCYGGPCVCSVHDDV